MTRGRCLPASTVSGLGCPVLSTLRTGTLQRPGTLVKTLCPPDRGAEVGTDWQLQPKAPFLGSYPALLRSCYWKERVVQGSLPGGGDPELFSPWGWAGLGEQG